MQLLHNIKYIGTALALALALSVTACGGKGKTAKDSAAVSSKPPVDITLPPVMEKASAADGEENNPDETISFEKWKQGQGQQAEPKVEEQ